jgi:hypothetical protein
VERTENPRRPQRSPSETLGRRGADQPQKDRNRAQTRQNSVGNLDG